MTREKEIEQASVDYQISKHPMAIGGDAFADMIYKMNINPSFIAGAEWADEHPNLEMKEVDLSKELDSYFAQFKGLEKSYWNWRIDSLTVHAQGIYDFAKHFFELGLKTMKGE